MHAAYLRHRTPPKASKKHVGAHWWTVANFGGVVMLNSYAISLGASCEESGGGEIRTHEAFRPSGFQDRRDQPLCHPSGRICGPKFITPLLRFSKPNHVLTIGVME